MSERGPSVPTVFVVVVGAVLIVLGLAAVGIGGLLVFGALIGAMVSDSPSSHGDLLVRAAAVLVSGVVLTGFGTAVVLGGPGWIISRRR